MKKLIVALIVSLLAATAHADWDPNGHIPEGGDNAWTIGRHDLRVSILGPTAFGITDRVELSTFLPLDLLLFPNLALKWRFHEAPNGSYAAKLGVGGGAYPIIGGAFIPYPPTGAGFIGLIGASYQKLDLIGSWHPGPTDRFTFSLAVAGFALEMGGVGIGSVDSLATWVPNVLPIALGGSAVGAMGGVELDYRIDRRNVFVFDADLWALRHAKDGLLVMTAGITHAWRHFHLTIGAYSLGDVPALTLWKESKMPVAPYANVYWTF
jgi:hypothetical protein